MSTSDTQTMRHLQQENIRLKSENNSMRDYVERLQRALRALVDLQHSIENINSNTNIFRLIHEVLTSALDAVDSENGSLLLLDEETGELVFVEVLGAAREKLLNYRLPKGVGVAGWVVKNRQAMLVEDSRREPLFTPMVDQYTGLDTQSLICIPLTEGERCLGAIEVVNTRSGRPFIESDKEVMDLIGRLAAVAIVAAEKVQP